MRRIKIFAYILFYIAIVTPVWLLDYFHTGDGPSHLYVATVLTDLVTDEHSVYADYFQLNVRPVPNVVVPLLYSGLLLVFSPFLATKVLLSIVVLLFTCGYFAFVSCISNRKVIPVCIFLLVYAFPLKMGLFGYLAGTGAMFLTLAFYIGVYRIYNKKHFIQLALLLLFTWMCHLFPFLLLFLLLPLYDLVIFLRGRELKPQGYLRKRAVNLIIVSLPGLLLTLLFSQEAVSATLIRHAGIETLNSWLFSITAMEFFGTDNEFVVRKIFYALLFLSLIILVVNRKRDDNGFLFLFSAFSLLMVLYFIMPDDFFSGGMINLRILYIMLIVICIAADVLLSWKWMQSVKLLLVLIAVYFSVTGAYINLRPYSDEVKALMLSARSVEPGSTILPVNYSEDYLHYNYLLYLSSGGNGVVLDNAQASTPNSVVRWKEQKWIQYNAEFLSSSSDEVDSVLMKELKEFDFAYMARWMPPDDKLLMAVEADTVYWGVTTGLQIVKMKKALR